MFVPFRDEGELLLPNETPEQAFHRLQNEGLLSHHEKLLKMAVRMMRRMMMEVAYRWP